VHDAPVGLRQHVLWQNLKPYRERMRGGRQLAYGRGGVTAPSI
jgi:hypothetical protein